MSGHNSDDAISRLSVQSDSKWVALKFDDRVFVLQKSTVLQFAPAGSLLHRLFSDEEESSRVLSECDRDLSHPHRPIIFDRSPDSVAPIFNFFRTGELVIPPNVSHRAVLLEAQYFGIDDIVRILQNVEPQFEDDADEGMADSQPCVAQATCDATKVARPCCTRADICASLRSLPPTFGLRLRGMVLNRIDFSKLDLSRTNFEHCALIFCNFSDCVLSEANFSHADCTGSDFSGAMLSHAICVETVFIRCRFERAHCSDSNFTGSIMRELRAEQCDFSRSLLLKCDLSHADLRGTVLHQTSMRYVNLFGVERSGTSISMGGVLS